MGHIERRQARIRRIRQRLNESTKKKETLEREKAPQSPIVDYHIGKTQVHPLDLGALAQKAGADPAAKVFFIPFFMKGAYRIDNRNLQRI